MCQATRHPVLHEQNSKHAAAKEAYRLFTKARSVAFGSPVMGGICMPIIEPFGAISVSLLVGFSDFILTIEYDLLCSAIPAKPLRCMLSSRLWY